MRFLIITWALIVLSISTHASPWLINHDISYEGSKIRNGIKKSNGPTIGHILYLQGLGDSMMNHEPLFNNLNENGFTVISFDYLGQGGSSGSMNRTTIHKINELADLVWAKHVPSSKIKKIILGWSTGGLAAYRYAHRNPAKTKAIILIAPGISPKLFVGETNLLPLILNPALCHAFNCKLLEITEKSLTQNKFLKVPNPHVDRIKPTSPLVVPSFSLNLIATAHHSKKWIVSDKVKGLVFLSDNKDTYVNREETLEIIEKNASHFQVVDYDGTGALHELDNELPSISQHLRSSIVEFLK